VKDNTKIVEILEM